MSFKISGVAFFTTTVLTAAVVHAGPGYQGRNGGTWVTGAETAEAYAIKRTRYTWLLSKHVFPQTAELRKGQSAEFVYRIEARRVVLEDELQTGVRGQLCVNNPGAAPTSGLRVEGQVQVLSGEHWLNVDGALGTLSTDAELGSGETRCFEYDHKISLHDGRQYRSRATITLGNYSGQEGSPRALTVMTPFELGASQGKGKRDRRHLKLDERAFLADTIFCPPGFTCSRPVAPRLLHDSAIIDYKVTVKNESLHQGHLTNLENEARLIAADTATEVKATANVRLSTGARRGD